MSRYRAVIADLVSGAEGAYEFQAFEGLLETAPARVMRVCMRALDKGFGNASETPYHIDFARRNDAAGLITIFGAMGGGDRRPFAAMIWEDVREPPSQRQPTSALQRLYALLFGWFLRETGPQRRPPSAKWLASGRLSSNTSVTLE